VLKAHIETGQENATDSSEAPHPRWVRINTLKTTLEDQLDTTFIGYEQAATIDAVRQRGTKRLHIDQHIPNLIAISPTVDISKSSAYKSGEIIFQDKASCFPAYLLDPLPEDGDVIDTCSAPGNKTTHMAAILIGHNSEPDECTQTIHAFEKNKGRAETLEKMVNLAGSQGWTKLHAGQDFLKTDPNSPVYKNVGALLLDPSCSGSGIVGRDEMPELHLPVQTKAPTTASKRSNKGNKTPELEKPNRKRKREDQDDLMDVMVDDDGVVTAVNTEDELKTRLTALSAFQLELLLHAFKYPAACKITYSTCSIHANENELVVKQALESTIAKERGWRLLKRDEQIRGMREWPVRGSLEACGEDKVLAESCIRANKGDEHGTMGFFLAGFVRSLEPLTAVSDENFLRDERGHLVRDLMGFPVRNLTEDQFNEASGEDDHDQKVAEEDEWTGFKDDAAVSKTLDQGAGRSGAPIEKPKASTQSTSKHAYNPSKKRPDLAPKKKQRKGGK